MHLLKITQICNKKFYLKGFCKDRNNFENKEFHAKMQPTRGWMLYEYA